LFTLEFSLQLALLGVGVGVFSAALGLGGGVLMVPAFLAFVPDIDAHTAKGTSLFIIIFVSGLNAWRQNRGLEKPWRLVALLAGGSVAGSYAGALLTSVMPEQVVLALFLLLLAVLTVRTFLISEQATHVDQVRWRPGVALGIGLLAGIAGGATGTGGGAVLIPLALMAGIVINARVVGLSNLVMVFTSISGSIAHFQADVLYPAPWTVGHVALSLVPLVFLGAQIGSELGYRINERMTLKQRRTAMGAMLLLISLQLFYRMLTH
jgi:uncharacterized protein